MIHDLTQIRKIRKKLGLTQSQLSKQANVSQSLIAKIEAGRLDPTFSKAMKIFNTLTEISKHSGIKAKDVMTKKIITAKPDESITDVIRVMKRYNISQMPVMDDNNCTGVISESLILDALIENKGKKVKDIMSEVPPIITSDTSLDLISQMLKFYQLVLVGERGRIKGILTKSDIINQLYR
jgi:predicted transcriptional regulator